MLANKIVRKMIGALPRGTIRQMMQDSAKHERSLNSVQLIGRSGGDPQKRGTDISPVVIFPLATQITYKDDNSIDGSGKSSSVQWHRICVFKPTLRDLVYQYLKKGHRIYVQGRISYGEVVDDSGKKIVLTSIIADDVIFLGNSN